MVCWLRMKTQLDSFTQSHLVKWLKWKYPTKFAEHLELIDSFLSDLDAEELRYQLGQGWRKNMAQAKKEYGIVTPMRINWRQCYPMNFR